MKCAQCGKEFVRTSKHPNQKFCSSACGALARKGRTLAKKTKKPPPPPKTLDQWSREALECNLDYGNYRMLIAAGKTFDELKATADTRHPAAHARAPKTYFH